MKILDEKKKKLADVILGISQLSGLSPADVKNVLDVLSHLLGEQKNETDGQGWNRIKFN
jgi:hypothetical protein